MADAPAAMEAAEQQIQALYTLRDTFFPGDPAVKKARVEEQTAAVLAALDAIPPESRRQAGRRAEWEYLRGKALDAAADYSKEAEEHLAKAVKLEPGLVDAWCCLGNCFWKKNDLEAAKNCFTQALAAGPHVRALQQLSMLERRMAQGGPGEAEAVEESIRLAKQALALDVKDGPSWYTLGNAYLTSFFVAGAGAWDLPKLRLALKAYQNAEKHEAGNSNPDLHFNSAIAHQYLEDYERALRAYQCAGARDPGLQADRQAEKLLRLLARLADLAGNKGRMKPKRLAAVMGSGGGVGGAVVPASHRPVGLDALQEGVNAGVAVACKVLLSVGHDQPVPLFFLLADSQESCVVLSVYALRPGVIKDAQTVTLLDPNFRTVSVAWQKHEFRYRAVRVDHPKQILLNGRSPSVQDAVCSTIHAQHVPP